MESLVSSFYKNFHLPLPPISKIPADNSAPAKINLAAFDRKTDLADARHLANGHKGDRYGNPPVDMTPHEEAFWEQFDR
jgi:hypothetical protein